MDAKTIWTHGCDACDADEPVEYVPALGYLCAPCRRPEEIDRLWRQINEAWERYRASVCEGPEAER